MFLGFFLRENNTRLDGILFFLVACTANSERENCGIKCTDDTLWQYSGRVPTQTADRVDLATDRRHLANAHILGWMFNFDQPEVRFGSVS